MALDYLTSVADGNKAQFPTYPALISKRITNKAAMAGGDSIADVRGTSSPRGFLLNGPAAISETRVKYAG